MHEWVAAVHRIVQPAADRWYDGTVREPIVNVRLAIRCASVEEFVDKYWRLVDGDRIFIFSSTPQAVGTRVRFHLVLSNGTSLVRGEGPVVRSRAGVEGDPSRPPGMDVRIEQLDDGSRDLVDFLRATRVEETDRERAARAPKPPPAPQPQERPPALPSEAREPPSVAAPSVVAPTSAPTGAPTAAIDQLIDDAIKETPVLPPGGPVRFAEQWRKAPEAAHVPAPAGTVPANPFAEINDDAIEFFVEWSLEHSKGEPNAESARY